MNKTNEQPPRAQSGEQLVYEYEKIADRKRRLANEITGPGREAILERLNAAKSQIENHDATLEMVKMAHHRERDQLKAQSQRLIKVLTSLSKISDGIGLAKYGHSDVAKIVERKAKAALAQYQKENQ